MRSRRWTLGVVALGGALGACGADESGAGGAGGAGAGPAGGGGTGTGDGGAGIVPTPGLGARMFVPRIVAPDGTAELWRFRQKSTIFWFGRVDSQSNYHDVRVGYGDDYLMVHVVVFDQKIYDEATDDGLDAWDSVALYLDTDGAADKSAIDGASWRFDAQAHRQGTDRTAVYRGDAGAWTQQAITVASSAGTSSDGLSVEKGYRGEERDQSRGWFVTFYLGWHVLGLGGPPSGSSQTLRAALVGTDRDDLAGTTGGDPQHWPGPGLDPVDPSTWGAWELLDGHFLDWDESGSQPAAGRPSYAIAHVPPAYLAGSETTVTIRHGLDGEVVDNAGVGASEVLCSGDDAYNFGDGPASWGGNTSREYFHVQNQADVADWPCFAKIYLAFPLTKLPAGQVVVSAELVLHHKQPTSGGDEGEQSLLQVLRVGNELQGPSDRWTGANLCWNQAPLPLENLAGTWGDRAGLELGWDALPSWTWDVSRGVAAAAAAGADRVSVAIYSADGEYHTGKQFVHSGDFEDWGDQSQRPSLTITCADPE